MERINGAMLLYKNNKISKELLSQINKYLIFSLFNSAVFIYTIIVLFYRHFELSFTYIMLISSIESWFSFLFEIPSGVLSDMWSRKKTVILGIALSAISMIAYIVYPSIALFIIAEALLATGGAFLSGTVSAIIYDKFKCNDIEEYYSDFLSLSTSRKFVVLGIVSVSSSLLFYVNIFLPFIISFICLFISLLIFLSITDEHDLNNTKYKSKAFISSFASNFHSIVCHIKKSLLLFKNNKILMWFTVLNAFFIVIISNIAYITQPFLQEKGFDVRYFGLFFFLCNISSAISARRSTWLYGKLKDFTFIIVALFLGITFIMLNINNLFFCLVILILSRLGNGVVFPILNVEINKITEDENRATVLSLTAFWSSIVLIVIDPIIGVIMDLHGIVIVCTILGIIALAAAAGHSVWKVIKSKKRR